MRKLVIAVINVESNTVHTIIAEVDLNKVKEKIEAKPPLVPIVIKVDCNSAFCSDCGYTCYIPVDRVLKCPNCNSITAIELLKEYK